MNYRPVIDYPGVQGAESVVYTLTQGITPSSATLVCDPASKVAQTGDLRIGDGVNPAIVLPRCRVVSVEASFSLGNFNLIVNIQDRRWMWAFGTIFGRYNVPVKRVVDIPRIIVDENGDPVDQPGNNLLPDIAATDPAIQENTKLPAQDLCILCLKAMGETRYDVRNIPRDDFPYVEWDASNPAQELQHLAERYGCRVVWNPASDTVTLAKQGEGNQLPTGIPGDIAQDAITFDPPEPPAKITVYGAPIEFQTRFLLEAVGLDFDGVYKPLDNLSYKPALGWSAFEPPFDFQTTDFAVPLPGGRAAADANALASQTVFRCYQIKETLPRIKAGEFWIPKPTQLTDAAKDSKKERDQITLLPYRVEAAVDDLGQRNLLPAVVYGVTDEGSASYSKTSVGDEVKASFDVDADNQLIKFESYQYWHTGSGDTTTISEATIVLECACTVTHNDNHQTIRYRKEFPIASSREGTRPTMDEMPILREDIRQYHRLKYTNTSTDAVIGTHTNEADCDKQAAFYVESEKVRYLPTVPQTRVYNAIMPVLVDGAIESVSWSASLGGVSTQASRGTELGVVTLKYPDRRRWENAKIEDMKRVQDNKLVIADLRRRQRILGRGRT